ncbi:ABC transporter ATP-binding protein [Oscillospiraceae bacterium HV4-5-C5C]|nr:ABC transporter ATP-binding protein [Oscillospiraceae bacterium HV4-5-C5C]
MRLTKSLKIHDTQDQNQLNSTDQRPIWRRLLPYILQQPGWLMAVAVTGIISSLSALLAPWLLGKAIDTLLGKGAVRWKPLAGLILPLALTYLASALFQWLMTASSVRLSNQVATSLRKASFDRLTRLPLSFLDQKGKGDLLSRLTTDLDAVNDGLNLLLNQLFSSLILLVGSLVMMFAASPWITILMLAIMPFNFLVTRFISSNSHHMFMEQANLAGRLNSYVDERVEQADLLRAFNQEEISRQDFHQLNEELYVVGQKAQFFSSLTNPGTRFVNNIAYVAVGLAATLNALAGRITIGQVSQLLNYTLQFAKPVNELSAVTTQLQNSLAGARRVFALMDQPEESDDASLPELKVSAGAVSFAEVRFSYRPDRPLITGLNLDIRPDASVAIVGPTGAGKTTLVNLLMRFYDPTGGQIFIDQQNITSVTRSSLRRSIGMVLQDSWLFAGSVRDNLAYGRPGASDAEIISAARAACADEFIRRLPQGYDTVLSDSGSNLSQGEKQLLTIARVMLLNPRLLILDEATSNIDTRTEILVQQAFLRLMEGRTSFIIAHRLSTIRNASLIIVMNQGSIVEQGTHDSLLQEKGLYYKLYESQFAGREA